MSHKFVGTKPKQILKKYVGLYEVVTDIDIERLEEMIEGFENRDEVFIMNPQTRYFSGLYQKKVNLKSQDVYYEFEDIRAAKGMRRGRFVLKLNASVGIRHFLKGVLSGFSFGRILKFEVKKLEFHERIEKERETERIM